MISRELTPTQMCAKPEYIAKLLRKLTNFVPAYSLQMNNPEILRDWVDDLYSYRLTVGDFDEAFRKIRDTFKTYPSMAEFKNILGVTVAPAEAIETVTNQIWNHLRNNGPLGIDSRDVLDILGGVEALAGIDTTNERDRFSLRQRVQGILATLGASTPDRLNVTKSQPSPEPIKVRLELIRAQASECIRDIGPIGYTDDGKLDHDEFHSRVNACREAWMPDDWWCDIRSMIIGKSIPAWQETGQATPEMFASLRKKMRGALKCMTS